MSVFLFAYFAVCLVVGVSRKAWALAVPVIGALGWWSLPPLLAGEFHRNPNGGDDPLLERFGAAFFFAVCGLVIVALGAAAAAVGRHYVSSRRAVGRTAKTE